MNVLYIFIGGGIGSVTRYGINTLFGKFMPSYAPYATLAANIIACFLLGLVLTFTTRNNDSSSALRNLMAVGFCGGLSTFSTFTAESHTMFQHQSFLYFSVNIIAHVLLCYASFAAGIYIIKN